MAKVVFIEGVSGVGKSTMVQGLEATLRNAGYCVRAYLEGDAENPIDFYAAAYFSAQEYQEFCRRYPGEKERVLQNTVCVGEARLVRYAQEGRPLFCGPVSGELAEREFSYRPTRRIPFAAYLAALTAAWARFALTLRDEEETDFFLFDGALLHHPINDMMRNYKVQESQAAEACSQLLEAIGTSACQICYLASEDIPSQLRSARQNRGQTAPTQEQIDWWITRRRFDGYVMGALDCPHTLYDISHREWEARLEEMASDLTAPGRG